MVYVIGLNTNCWFPHLTNAVVGESVGTHDVSMRGCM